MTDNAVAPESETTDVLTGNSIQTEVFYVNEYLTNRIFGGPEEGGWWYAGAGGALSPARSADHVGAGYVVVPSLFLVVPADPEVSQEDKRFEDDASGKTLSPHFPYG